MVAVLKSLTGRIVVGENPSKMQISKVEHFRVRLPLRRPHRIAGQISEAGDYTIVRISTDTGETGLGEATVLPDWGGSYAEYFGETNETVASVIDHYLSRVIMKRDPLDLGILANEMDALIVGYPYAKAAINMALLDIVGKSFGLPVFRLLSGGGYTKKVPIAHSIGLMDIDAAVSEAMAVKAEGIKTIKVKIGVDPRRDIAIVESIRNAVGPNIRMTVDANQGYRTAKLAIQTIKKMDAYDVEMVEQPVRGLDHMALVRRNVLPLVMADESAWTPHDVLEIYKRSAADSISVYTTKPGGLSNAIKVAAVAEAAGLPCNVNGSIESGVGVAADLHLAASSPIINLPCVIPITSPEGKEQTKVAARFYLDDIVLKPYKYEDGHLLVPDGPGLGCELDEQKLKKYAVPEM